MAVLKVIACVLSAKLRKQGQTSEEIALRDPVMPVADGFGG
jgi:hypothetical protein